MRLNRGGNRQLDRALHTTRGDGDDAWVEIDLGASVRVSEVLFGTRSMSDGSSITETFSLTVDGTERSTFSADELVKVDSEARILRFDVVTSSGGNTRGNRDSCARQEHLAPQGWSVQPYHRWVTLPIM
jgi:hypothetical protein